MTGVITFHDRMTSKVQTEPRTAKEILVKRGSSQCQRPKASISVLILQRPQTSWGHRRFWVDMNTVILMIMISTALHLGTSSTQSRQVSLAHLNLLYSRNMRNRGTEACESNRLERLGSGQTEPNGTVAFLLL